MTLHALEDAGHIEVTWDKKGVPLGMIVTIRPPLIESESKVFGADPQPHVEDPAEGQQDPASP